MLHHAARSRNPSPSLAMSFSSFLVDAAARAYVRVRLRSYQYAARPDALATNGTLLRQKKASCSAGTSAADGTPVTTVSPEQSRLRSQRPAPDVRGTGEVNIDVSSRKALFTSFPDPSRGQASASSGTSSNAPDPNSKWHRTVQKSNPWRWRGRSPISTIVHGPVDPDSLSEVDMGCPEPSSYTLGEDNRYPLAGAVFIKGHISLEPEQDLTRQPDGLMRPLPSAQLSSRDFVHHLQHASLDRPAMLKSLASLHSDERRLQSTKSYNLLIGLAIRHTHFDMAHDLLCAMEDSQIEEDAETWKLRVRLLVREGRWPEAWAVAMSRQDGEVGPGPTFGGVPLAVWTELLGTKKHGAPQHRRRIRHALPLDQGLASMERYETVMQQRGLLEMSGDEQEMPPPRVVHNAVEGLLRMGEQGTALAITTHFLPFDPNGSGLRLVHLHLGIRPRARGLREFNAARRELRQFMEVCPALKPDATALFLILGHLKRSKRGGSIGWELSGMFKRRWGSRTESPGVMRRLLGLATREGRRDAKRGFRGIGKQRALERRARKKAGKVLRRRCT
ncbi:hypothetical protein DENSPDRAFT_484751 [Dentipellis sp. KUC8613]|nr:hypothetical protein DENSPDRAFT_484751 [Dentipellis sp. KUC8613]